MNCDRDIRWMITVIWSLVAADLIFAGWAIYRHEWANVITGGLLGFNCRGWVGTLRVQQRTRDEIRIVDAAIQGHLDGWIKRRNG